MLYYSIQFAQDNQLKVLTIKKKGVDPPIVDQPLCIIKF